MSTQDPPDSTPRRHRSPLVVVSVAAAVLLAGGGGAYWASTAGDGGGSATPGENGAPPPLALDGYVRGAAQGSQSPGSRGIAPGEPDPHGNARYRATGKLPDGPGSAPVYLSQDDIGREQVARLAKALHVPGTPRLDGGTWKVGAAQGKSGPSLQVSRKGPGSWSYARYGTLGGSHCEHPPGVKPDAAGQNGGVTGSGGSGSSASGSDDSGSGDSGSGTSICPSYRDGSNGSGAKGGGSKPVSEAAAKRAAEPVLDSVGQRDAKLDAAQLFGATRVVKADPVLGGLPTYGWQTSLQVGYDGQLTGGSGQLAKPEKADSYPVVSASAALDQLNKGAGNGRVGTGGCATSAPLSKDGEKGGGKAGEASTLPCTPKAKADPVAVRGATFTLAARTVAGRQALVPSWLFATQVPGTQGEENTFTVDQPAVDPKFVKDPEPSSPAPSQPSGSAKAEKMRISSYSVNGKDGTMLTLHYSGGVCSDYTATARDQSAGSVTVGVTGKEKHPGRVCVMMAKQFDQTVRLDKPLDGRKVVDAMTGQAVPEK
ncbi:hypothetical protein AB0I22_37360 [Streptomyces sp. NPDC050610]|uniref:hypothetical protein n=1 Tax=Streptomyces sp. NPDC050610 TaxID=3157097 RepID=UPI00341456F5